jgi:lysozyme family protein
MKKLVILLLLLISCNSHAPEKEIKEEKLIEQYSDFKTAYLHIRKWEGNYGKYWQDPGGETYGGIARNYNKDWYGWKIFDIYKSRRELKNGDNIPELEFWVIDYYLTIWLKDGYSKITNQKVATYLFDYRNSGPIAYVHTKRVLVNMGYIIDTQSTIDDRFIHIINNVNPDLFVKNLQKIRMTYYVRTVKKHPEQLIFIEGWLNRVYDI